MFGLSSALFLPKESQRHDSRMDLQCGKRRGKSFWRTERTIWMMCLQRSVCKNLYLSVQNVQPLTLICPKIDKLVTVITDNYQDNAKKNIFFNRRTLMWLQLNVNKKLFASDAWGRGKMNHSGGIGPFLPVTLKTAMMSETTRVKTEITVISSFNNFDLFFFFFSKRIYSLGKMSTIILKMVGSASIDLFRLMN